MKSPQAAGRRVVHRGEVYIANVSDLGGRLRKIRPVLIVQNDMANDFSPETIIVSLRHADPIRRIPVRVPVPKGVAGLDRDSHVDAGQVQTILQQDLGRLIGKMPDDLMASVDQAMAISLGLTGFGSPTGRPAPPRR
jgi:mRNA interferase MazF